MLPVNKYKAPRIKTNQLNQHHSLILIKCRALENTICCSNNKKLSTTINHSPKRSCL